MSSGSLVSTRSAGATRSATCAPTTFGRTGLAEQHSYFPAVVLAQSLDADAGQHARQVDLRTAIAPDLTDDRRTRPDRYALLLEHPEPGTQHAIAAVDGDERKPAS